MEIDENRIYKNAIAKFGIESQLDMVVEECAELIQAVNKFKRSYGSHYSIQSVVEEMADVDIMINQLKIIINKFESNVDQSIVGFGNTKTNKLLRLKELIDD